VPILQVESKFVEGPAAAGGTGAAFAGVSVMRSDGSPVRSLPGEAFRFSVITGETGQGFKLTATIDSDGTANGLYTFFVFPGTEADNPQLRWPMPGEYVIGVEVYPDAPQGSDHGQTLGVLTITRTAHTYADAFFAERTSRAKSKAKRQ
jgi:hypothetical protein